MDNLGFKNWGNSPISNVVQDRYDSFEFENDSPASFYGNRPLGTKRRADTTTGRESYSGDELGDSNFASPASDAGERFGKYATKSKNESHYDFEISNDDYNPVNNYGYNSKVNWKEDSKQIGRRSVDDRAKEILERNKARNKAEDVDDQLGSVLASYESTLKDLMEGISIPENAADPAATATSANSAFSPDSIGREMRSHSFDSSALMDSFEISAADLEVGALAAKRAKEKAAERKKRRSFDYPPGGGFSLSGGTGSAPLTVASSIAVAPREDKTFTSPDAFDKGRSHGQGAKGVQQTSVRPSGGFHLSTALSSINKNSEDFDKIGEAEEGILRYGSIERSDDDLYKMLNVSDTDRVSVAVKSTARLGRLKSDGSDISAESSPSPDPEPDPPSPLRSTGKDEYSFDDFEQDYSPAKAKDTVMKTSEGEKVEQNKELESGTTRTATAEPLPVDKAEQVRLTQLEEIMKRWSAPPDEQLRALTSTSFPNAELKEKDGDDCPQTTVVESGEAVKESPQKIFSEGDDYADDQDFEQEQGLRTDPSPELPPTTEESSTIPSVPYTTTGSELGPLDNTAQKSHSIEVQQDSEHDNDRKQVNVDEKIQSVKMDLPVLLPSQSNILSSESEAGRTKVTSDLHFRPKGPLSASRYSDPDPAEDDSRNNDYLGKLLVEPFHPRNPPLPPPSRSESGTSIAHSHSHAPEGETRFSPQVDSFEPTRRRDYGDGDKEDFLKPIYPQPQPSILQFSHPNHDPPNQYSIPLPSNQHLPSAAFLLQEQLQPLPPPPMLPQRDIGGEKLVPGMAASTAAKLQRRQRQQQGSGRSRSAADDVADEARAPKIMVIASNLHNLGTVSSLNKQHRRSREEESLAATEKLRQDNASLNRRLDRLGRETKDLRESFFAVAALAQSTGQQGGWGEAAASAITEKALSVKIKEEELRLREGVLNTRESQVLTAEEYLLTNIRDRTARDAVDKATLLARSTAQQAREAQLLRELEAVKAATLKQEQDFDAEGRPPLISARYHPSRIPVVKCRTDKVQANRKKYTPIMGTATIATTTIEAKDPEQGADNESGSGRNGKIKETENEVEMVYVPRVEYESLIKELSQQEVLLDGFQLENERLAQQLRDREEAENARSALHYDKQQALNKEINRLKNMIHQSDFADGVPNFGAQLQGLNATNSPWESTGFIGHSLRRSSTVADSLRAELDKDAIIRSLQERLSVSEAGLSERERDLRDQVAKLQQENRELVREVNATARMARRAEAAANWQESKLESESVSILREELSRLQRKVAWFNSNQPLIQQMEQETNRMRQAMNTLAAILVAETNLRPEDVQRMIRKAREIAQDQELQTDGGLKEELNDKSFSSTSSPNPSRSSVKSNRGRSIADIKKIKALEQQVRELQDSLLKRHPDSIAAMLRAASVDEVKAEAMDSRAKLEIALTEAREQLLKEREDFDKKLRSLRQEHERLEQQFSARLAQQQRQEKRGFDSGLSEDDQKSAHERLEYSGNVTSKVKAVVVRNLGQALSRIRDLEENIEKIQRSHRRRIENMQKKHEEQLKSITETNEKEGDRNVAHDGQSLAEMRRFYTERLGLLESELMRTAEELGALKRAQADVASRDSNHASSARAEIISSDMLLSTNKQLESALAAAKDQLKFVQDEMKMCKEACERSAERERRATEHCAFCEQQCNSLKTELAAVSARLLDALQQPKQPHMAMFMSMEQQLRHLEERLQRRDRELATAIEDGKAAAKLEAARLKDIHLQELREKDEQLKRFQSELKQLVMALRAWHSAQNHQAKETAEESSPSRSFSDGQKAMDSVQEMLLKY